MTEPEAKRVKVSDNNHDDKDNDDGSPPYELIYWPGIPGRGELVRLLFEEAGVSYVDVAKNDPEGAVPAVLGCMAGENLGDGANPPVFAPPVLRHGGLVISQTANILQYLAPRLGLGPKVGDEGDGDGVYRLNGIAMTVVDGLLAEVHETHHPVATGLYYEDQKEEARRRAKGFREERLPKYLTYMQRVLDGEASGEGPWLYGGRLTYVDLVAFQCVDGTQYAFPKTMARMKESGKYDGVFRLYDAVKERPNVKAYLESERRVKYGDGIWRYYPELEEED